MHHLMVPLGSSLAAMLLLLANIASACGPNTPKDPCYYIKPNMTIDHKNKVLKPVNEYGDVEIHPHRGKYTIQGCGTVGFYSRDKPITVGSNHPLQFRIGVNGIWKTGYGEVPGTESVWYRCGQSLEEEVVVVKAEVKEEGRDDKEAAREEEE